MRAAVLGHPIRHSLSPVLHNAAYAALGRTDWSYEAIDCDVDELGGLLDRSGDWAGFSCTMPLKHIALELADEVDALARAVGAANTLLPRTGGGWRAANTDVAGIVGALGESRVALSSVTILGAGGTAQAALGALRELGLNDCVVLVREVSRAAALAATAGRLGVTISVELLSTEAAALDAGLVISTLPKFAADAVAGRSWRAGQAVLDAVYDPWPTALAAAAADAGATIVSGALMLLHQAAAQVELMTGCEAPVDAMRAALRAAVPDSGV